MTQTHDIEWETLKKQGRLTLQENATGNARRETERKTLDGNKENNRAKNKKPDSKVENYQQCKHNSSENAETPKNEKRNNAPMEAQTK